MDHTSLQLNQADIKEFLILGYLDATTGYHQFMNVSGQSIGKLIPKLTANALADTDDKRNLIFNTYDVVKHDPNYGIYIIKLDDIQNRLNDLDIQKIRQPNINMESEANQITNVAERLYKHQDDSRIGNSTIAEWVSADILKIHPVFNELSKIHDSKEGNLLENIIDIETRDSQVSFFKHAMNTMKINGITRGNFLETGTNKGYFGFMISQFFGPTTLHTFDLNPSSGKCIPILASVGMNVIFNYGDSTKILKTYTVDKPIIFTWVDGGHRYEEALADLTESARLKSKYIAIDDMKFFSGNVDRAFEDFLAQHPEYTRLTNPFWDSDKVGIAWCVRTSD